MDIKVLESICCAGESLTNVVESVLKKLEVDAIVTQISDFTDIARYGVLSLPAIIINNKFVVKGSMPSEDVMIELIRKEL